MKAHYDGLTCRQKKIITDVAVRTATRLADQQKEAIAIRSQYLVFVAMLECGLSPKTVNRVAAMLSLVKDKYAHYQEDNPTHYLESGGLCVLPALAGSRCTRQKDRRSRFFPVAAQQRQRFQCPESP